jgi:hypothetical protein
MKRTRDSELLSPGSVTEKTKEKIVGTNIKAGRRIVQKLGVDPDVCSATTA